MTPIQSVNATALLILRQTSQIGQGAQGEPTSPDLTSVANGLGRKIGVSASPGRLESKISEAMFSVNNVNITKLKIELIDRAAEKMGFDRLDYDSDGKFSSAMRISLVKLAKMDGGEEQIAKWEKELGLEKLRVTLMDVVNSARDPEAEDKVSAALKAREGVEGIEKERRSDRSRTGVDELGVYDPTIRKI